MVRIEEFILFGKKFRQFYSAVRVDMVFIRVNRQSIDFKVFRDIGGGIDDMDIRIFGCQFFNVVIAFRGRFSSRMHLTQSATSISGVNKN